MKGEIASVVKSVLSKAARSNKDFADFLKINQNWKKIAGESMSRAARPHSIKDGTLMLIVEDGVWANEISMYKTQLCLEIIRQTKCDIFNIRTRIGKIEKEAEPTEQKSEDTDKRVLTEEEKAELERIIEESGMQDEGLKQDFRRAYISYLINN